MGSRRALGNVGTTAWTALEALAGVRARDRVLVHGGSDGVGHMAVQIAAKSGAEVITTAGTAHARERLEHEFGASAAVDDERDSLAADMLVATDGGCGETVRDHRLEQYLDLDLEVVTSDGQSISDGAHPRDERATVLQQGGHDQTTEGGHPETTPRFPRSCPTAAGAGCGDGLLDSTSSLDEAA